MVWTCKSALSPVCGQYTFSEQEAQGRHQGKDSGAEAESAISLTTRCATKEGKSPVNKVVCRKDTDRHRLQSPALATTMLFLFPSIETTLNLLPSPPHPPNLFNAFLALTYIHESGCSLLRGRLLYYVVTRGRLKMGRYVCMYSICPETRPGQASAINHLSGI